MKAVGRLVSVAALAVVSLTAGVVPAEAATGPSGVNYTFTTVCATGAVTVTADARGISGPGPSATVSYQGFTETFAIVPGAISHRNLSGYSTLPNELISVAENGSTVTSTSYAVTCPNYLSTQQSAVRSRFVAMSPDRILDTRPATRKNYSGLKPSAGGVFDLVLPGLGGIPAEAKAVVLNVTATEAEAPGFVQLFPAGQSTPGSSSNLNVEGQGQSSIPNAVIVPLGTGGAVSFFTASRTHLLVDVSGYFLPVGPSEQVAGGRLIGAAPTRVLDTRTATAANYSGSKPVAGQIVDLPVTAIVGAPLATEISAVVLNVAATEASGPGFVQAAAGGAITPGTSSNLNLNRAGQTIANLVIVPVSATGTVSLYTSGGTHLLADVMGYFSSNTTVPGRSGLFVPLPPERLADSRNLTRIDGGDFAGLPGERIRMYFGGLPLDLLAVTLNVTATFSTAPGFVQVGPDVVAARHSNLNLERAGQTIPNAVLAPVSSFNDLDFYTNNGTQIIVDIFGWFTY